jgi:NTE family protein
MVILHYRVILPKKYDDKGIEIHTGENILESTSISERMTERRLVKKKLGIALGCGGAKGMAHLGVLKAFEEENIFFDEYAGASIGSIVGALRAYGYRSDELKERVFNLYLGDYVRYLRPYMDMTFIEELLNDYLHGITFEELAMPFFAWATDKETMQGVLLSSGSVARACTASSAVPPYFHAVDMAGKSLIDGVFTDPVPADVLRLRGIDFVVGVDLNEVPGSYPAIYHNRLTHLISNTIDSTVKLTPVSGALERGYDACDFMLKPKLGSYAVIDASRRTLQLMFDAGYAEAKRCMNQILQKMREKGIFL